ncbi:hypothetical protein PJP07_30880, partial [Mycobacterium kansasii]
CILRGQVKLWARWIWDEKIPLKIFIFIWSLIQGVIMVDEKIKRKGINLASRCVSGVLAVKV